MRKEDSCNLDSLAGIIQISTLICTSLLYMARNRNSDKCVNGPLNADQNTGPQAIQRLNETRIFTVISQRLSPRGGEMHASEDYEYAA